MLTDIREARLKRSMSEVLRILGKGKCDPGTVDSLCRVFRLPSVALEASESDIARAASCDANAAFALSMALPVACYMLSEAADGIRQVTTLEQARQKLLPPYLGTHYEHGRMLCLDKQGNFISCVPLRMGSVDEAPFYLRIIVEEALISDAECFIIAHNHPGGTRYPSPEDCSITRSVMKAMSMLQMTLIDHIIMADGDAVSIRGLDSIERETWDKFAPLPAAFASWLQ